MHEIFYGLDLKKGNGRLEKHAIDTPDSKTAADSKAKGKKGYTHVMLGWCQGKEARILRRLNYSIYQHTGIGCDTSFSILPR